MHLRRTERLCVLPVVKIGWTSGKTDWFPNDTSEIGVSLDDETTVIGKQRRWRLADDEGDDVLESYEGEFAFESRSCSNERFNAIHEAIICIYARYLWEYTKYECRIRLSMPKDWEKLREIQYECIFNCVRKIKFERKEKQTEQQKKNIVKRASVLNVIGW